VILLDIHLPGMDGYAVLKALKSRTGQRPFRVIALSADAMPLDIEKAWLLALATTSPNR